MIKKFINDIGIYKLQRLLLQGKIQIQDIEPSVFDMLIKSIVTKRITKLYPMISHIKLSKDLQMLLVQLDYNIISYIKNPHVDVEYMVYTILFKNNMSSSVLPNILPQPSEEFIIRMMKLYSLNVVYDNRKLDNFKEAAIEYVITFQEYSYFLNLEYLPTKYQRQLFIERQDKVSDILVFQYISKLDDDVIRDILMTNPTKLLRLRKFDTKLNLTFIAFTSLYNKCIDESSSNSYKNYAFTTILSNSTPIHTKSYKLLKIIVDILNVIQIDTTITPSYVSYKHNLYYDYCRPILYAFQRLCIWEKYPLTKNGIYNLAIVDRLIKDGSKLPNLIKESHEISNAIIDSNPKYILWYSEYM